MDGGLYYAAAHGRTEVVEFLLSHGVEVSNTIAIAATRHLPVFQMLVKHGFDMNSTEFKVAPLKMAVGRHDVLQWMLEHGADPNIEDERGRPLTTAIAQDDVAAGRMLLDHGATAEPHLIYRAIGANGGLDLISEEMLRLLIAAGVNVNYVVPGKGTALHYAAWLDNKEKVQMLLRLGANPNILFYDKLGHFRDGEEGICMFEEDEAITPADIAKKLGHDEVYEILMAATVEYN